MPAISPNGARIAYSREAAGPGPDLPFGSPRIWVLDLQSGQNSAVYADQQIIRLRSRVVARLAKGDIL